MEAETTDPADGQHALAEESIDLLTGHLRAMDRIEAAAERASASLLGYGWWVRIVRTALAVRTLHQDGLGHEAAPLVRTILHHAAALCWLVREPDRAAEAVKYQASSEGTEARPGRSYRGVGPVRD